MRETITIDILLIGGGEDGDGTNGGKSGAIAYIKDVNIPDNTKFDITIGKKGEDTILKYNDISIIASGATGDSGDSILLTKFLESDITYIENKEGNTESNKGTYQINDIIIGTHFNITDNSIGFYDDTTNRIEFAGAGKNINTTTAGFGGGISGHGNPGIAIIKYKVKELVVEPITKIHPTIIYNNQELFNKFASNNEKIEKIRLNAIAGSWSETTKFLEVEFIGLDQFDNGNRTAIMNCNITQETDAISFDSTNYNKLINGVKIDDDDSNEQLYIEQNTERDYKFVDGKDYIDFTLTDSLYKPYVIDFKGIRIYFAYKDDIISKINDIHYKYITESDIGTWEILLYSNLNNIYNVSNYTIYYNDLRYYNNYGIEYYYYEHIIGNNILEKSIYSKYKDTYYSEFKYINDTNYITLDIDSNNLIALYTFDNTLINSVIDKPEHNIIISDGNKLRYDSDTIIGSKSLLLHKNNIKLPSSINQYIAHKSADYIATDYNYTISFWININNKQCLDDSDDYTYIYTNDDSSRTNNVIHELIYNKKTNRIIWRRYTIKGSDYTGIISECDFNRTNLNKWIFITLNSYYNSELHSEIYINSIQVSNTLDDIEYTFKDDSNKINTLNDISITTDPITIFNINNLILGPKDSSNFIL